MLCLAGKKVWAEAVWVFIYKKNIRGSTATKTANTVVQWINEYPFLLLALCNIASTSGAIWWKYSPNSDITNDSPWAIAPLSTKGGMYVSSPHKEGKMQTGIINFNQRRWYFHCRVCTDFLQWPFLLVHRKYSHGFLTCGGCEGWEEEPQVPVVPPDCSGQEISKTRRQVWAIQDGTFIDVGRPMLPGVKHVLGSSLNMVWKLKSRLTYFKSLIQKRRHIRQDKTKWPMFTNLIPQVASFDWPLSHQLLQSDDQVTFCNLLLLLVDLTSTKARPKLNERNCHLRI